MAKVSIIAPTYQRKRHHENLYRCFAQQTHPDCELLILDDSFSSSNFFIELENPCVRYVYTPRKMTIGDKRNALIEMAEGDIIVHFDDDDYYAPHYVKTMVAALENADLVKLSGWFAYATRDRKFFYWDTATSERLHFIVQSTGIQISDTAMPPDSVYANLWGFGFSYVYRRAVWETCRFEAVDFGEDFRFICGLAKQGARMKTFPDTLGLTLHCLHQSNTSRIFPQYYLPPLALNVLFGEAVKPYLCV